MHSCPNCFKYKINGSRKNICIIVKKLSKYIMEDAAYTILIFLTIFITGSPKKQETWKTTWGLLIDILFKNKRPFN